MNRRRFILAAAVAALSSGVARAREEEPPPKPARRPPNIVLLLADDLGYGDLGCYGHPTLQTPHLDGLARDGARFTQFYASSPVCSPTRAAILTGRDPAELRIHHAYFGPASNAARGMPNFLDPRLPNLAQTLADAGYATGHFGKWHLGYGVNAAPTRYGFGEAKTYSGAQQPAHALSSASIVDDTLAFVRAHRDRPFFANAWFQLPHAPLNPTLEQLQRYAHLGPVDDPTPEQVYHASVSATDDAVGTLLAGLRELGVADDTIVVFTSDNGPETPAIGSASRSAAGSTGGLRGRKRSLYEGGVRVPLLVRAPGRVAPGRVEHAVSSTADLFPTLATFAGVRIPPRFEVDGLNLAPVWRRTSRRPWPRPEPLLWEFRFTQYGDERDRSPRLAIRDRDWKLLCEPDGSRLELYDLRVDRGETTNLADAHADIAADLRRELLAWHATLPADVAATRQAGEPVDIEDPASE